MAMLGTRGKTLISRTGRRMLRLISIGIGAYIEYHEIFQAQSAQVILVFLGLWFMSVPPALWLDSLWRLSQAASNLTPRSPLEDKQEPRPKDGGEK